jgi:hypothetical protein
VEKEYLYIIVEWTPDGFKVRWALTGTWSEAKQATEEMAPASPEAIGYEVTKMGDVGKPAMRRVYLLHKNTWSDWTHQGEVKDADVDTDAPPVMWLARAKDAVGVYDIAFDQTRDGAIRHVEKGAEQVTRPYYIEVAKYHLHYQAREAKRVEPAPLPGSGKVQS